MYRCKNLIFGQSRIFFLIVFFFSEIVFSQSAETIRSGRPGESIGPYVVGKNYLQIQTGLMLAESSPSGFEKLKTQDSNTVIRYGLSETLEVSSLIVYQRDQVGESNQENTGLSRFDLGFRLNLNDAPQGLIPAVGFQTRMKLDTVSREFRSKRLTPIMLLVTQHKLTQQISWIHNFGLNYGDEGSDPNYFWISNLSFPVTAKIGAFVELYGNKTQGESSYYYDGGLSYLLNKDLQLDIYAGSDLTSGLQQQFVNIGLSWRTKIN